MITLKEAKAHLYVAHPDSDDLITSYIGAATVYLSEIGVTIPNVGDLPLPIKQAVLMMVGHFYEHREGAINERVYRVPMGVDALIAPYRNLDL